ncbi:ATP-binding cassette domain-containing protein [Ferrimicrobium sp.]|uniref:ATP-binding cassette domain-containing protein n=1 Tax=Ferrimicrobium sp. TaxID=2926050 RepID=UPI0026048AB2|nr:ATP-binding cassette domain-containing protein [Ferrimicrobium sp.]
MLVTDRSDRSAEPRSSSLLRGVVASRRSRLLIALIVVVQVVALVSLVAAALLIGRMLEDAVMLHRYGVIPRLAVLFGVAFGIRLAMLRLVDYLAVLLGVDYAQRVVGRLIDRGSASPITGTEFGYLLTDGVATLVPYASRFLPEVIGAAIVTPALILFTLLESPMAFIEVIGGLLVLPVIMIVVGKSTKDRADRQLGATVRLNALYLDMLSGMVTLKSFNKAHLQETSIARAAQDLRKRTLGVLSVAFISGVSLDTLVAIIVALVAVSIGIRLNDASMSLATGAAVLFVVPEIFRPVRAAALQFHATQDAAAMLRRVDALTVMPLALEDVISKDVVPVRVKRGDKPWGSHRLSLDSPGLELKEFGVALPNGKQSAGIDLVASFGELIVLRGQSGVGKTSWLEGMAGFLPTVGALRVESGDWTGALPRDKVGFLPANPGFVDGSIYDNVTLLNPGAGAGEVEAVLALVGADGFVERLSQQVLPDGSNLSAGERQRLGVARVLLMERPFLLLDEPTAHLNTAMERQLLDTLLRIGDSKILFVASHSDRVEARASQVLGIGAQS